MLDSQKCLQKYFKNAKTSTFLSELTFYTSEGHTCKILSFYDFWFTVNDKFCSPYPIIDFYAYLIMKIGNRNLKINLHRLKFVMQRPELKIPTLAKWLISPLVRVIIKICKKHLVLKTNSNINIYNET